MWRRILRSGSTLSTKPHKQIWIPAQKVRKRYGAGCNVTVAGTPAAAVRSKVSVPVESAAIDCTNVPSTLNEYETPGFSPNKVSERVWDADEDSVQLYVFVVLLLQLSSRNCIAALVCGSIVRDVPADGAGQKERWPDVASSAKGVAAVTMKLLTDAVAVLVFRVTE